ncbi:class I SAM-dependent methyltransferase [Streptomyces griseus]|uniref:class I SAM-dependent methyltransferase n=1 Tax=Streptomyces griseus TaxID=1911 RepID=UPI00381F456B
MREARMAAEVEQEAFVRGVLEDYYRDGKPPWDGGVTPPELVAVTEGPGALKPGRALELGCGTGTNAVYLARHGWQVVAVDLVDRPVRQAREKADAAGADVSVLCGDATATTRGPASPRTNSAPGSPGGDWST